MFFPSRKFHASPSRSNFHGGQIHSLDRMISSLEKAIQTNPPDAAAVMKEIQVLRVRRLAIISDPDSFEGPRVSKPTKKVEQITGNHAVIVTGSSTTQQQASQPRPIEMGAIPGSLLEIVGPLDVLSAAAACVSEAASMTQQQPPPQQQTVTTTPGRVPSPPIAPHQMRIQQLLNQRDSPLTLPSTLPPTLSLANFTSFPPIQVPLTPTASPPQQSTRFPISLLLQASSDPTL